MESIIYVGMDVHKDSYSVCCYKSKEDRYYYEKKILAESKRVIKYLEAVKNLEKKHYLYADMRQDQQDSGFIGIYRKLVTHV